MARRDWITKVKAPTMALRVKSGGQKHNAEIAMLSMRDWRDINNEVEENMWEILLDLFGDMTKEQLDTMISEYNEIRSARQTSNPGVEN